MSGLLKEEMSGQGPGPKTRMMIRVLRPIPAESLKLLVFDLDGTLIDPTQDLSNSVNAALLHFGRKPLPEEIIAGFVGNGAPMLMRRALAAASGVPVEQVSEDLLAPFYEYFLDYYLRHELDHTCLFAGVYEALLRLHKGPSGASRTMAVLSNKPARPSREILEGLGIASHFQRIYGGDTFSVTKPDPMGLLLLMKETGARPEETVMIGDSKADVLTARNAGAWSLGCAFGFGPQNLMDVPPDIVVNSAEAWPAVLAATRNGLAH